MSSDYFNILWSNLGPFLKKNNSQELIANLWSALSDVSDNVNNLYDTVENDLYLSTATPLYNIGGTLSLKLASGYNGYFTSTPLIVDDQISLQKSYKTSNGIYTLDVFDGTQTWDQNGTQLTEPLSSLPVGATDYKINVPLTNVYSSLIYSHYAKVFDYNFLDWVDENYLPYYVTGLTSLHKHVIWGLVYLLHRPFSLKNLEGIFNIIYNNPVKLPGTITYDGGIINIDPETVNYFEPLTTTHITIDTDTLHPFWLTVNVTGNIVESSPTYDNDFVTHFCEEFLPKHLKIEVE
jgi:hypothetical protein